MKLSRNTVVGCLAMGFALLLSSSSFADNEQANNKQGNKEQANKERQEAFVKLLNDSAAALQASRPDIEASLVKLVHEMQSKTEVKMEPGKKTENEKKERRTARIKIMRDAASALQQLRPDLSADLTKFADQKAKKMA